MRGSLAARGYDLRRFRIRVRVHRQIPDIAGGVDQSLEARQGQQDAYATIGAGDQGTVYGYATNETEERLPLPLVYAQRICQRLDEAFYQFLLAAFTNMVAASEAGALAYVFHADTEGLNFRKAFKEAGLYLSGTCIWVKDSLVLDRSPYQWQHEPILFTWPYRTGTTGTYTSFFTLDPKGPITGQKDIHLGADLRTHGWTFYTNGNRGITPQDTNLTGKDTFPSWASTNNYSKIVFGSSDLYLVTQNTFYNMISVMKRLSDLMGRVNGLISLLNRGWVTSISGSGSKYLAATTASASRLDSRSENFGANFAQRKPCREIVAPAAKRLLHSPIRDRIPKNKSIQHPRLS